MRIGSILKCIAIRHTNQNTMKHWNFKFFLVAMLAFLSQKAFTQINYRQVGAIQVSIAGTSTLHDWTMTSNEATCHAVFEAGADGVPIKFQSVSFTMAAESLKSGKGAMDHNAYSALKTDKHKNISFQLSSAQISQKVVQAKGNLTIAGVTKPIDLNVTYDSKSGNPAFRVNKKIKMSEFGVEPPSFMFGSVKTGDEITISIDVTLTPSKI